MYDILFFLLSRCPGSTNAKNNAMASEIAQENQAIKRQKLDGGRSRQVPVSFKCEEHSFRFWSLMVLVNSL